MQKKNTIRNKVIELSKEGKSNIEISRELKIFPSTVYYHLNKEYREKRIKKMIEDFQKKPKEEKKKIYEKRKEYVKKYLRERYRNDEVFREKHKARVLRYQRGLSTK